MNKREIYNIVFNKFIQDGILRTYAYTLGEPSPNHMRVPLKIELKEDRIIVTFTDNTRHTIGYTNDVEIFDREVKPKEDASRDNNTNKTAVRKRKDSE